MRSLAIALACSVFSFSGHSFAQSARSADIEIGEAAAPATTTATPPPTGPVIGIGEPEPVNRPRSMPVASQTVYVAPDPAPPSAYSPYLYAPRSYPAQPNESERVRHRFQRMGVAGGVILSSLLLITVIGGVVALAGRPTNGVDVAQGWLTFVPVIGPAVGGVLEISQGFIGSGALAAVLIVDALGQAAGTAMLARGLVLPPRTPTHPREQVQWSVTPWIGSASGLAVTVTMF